MWTRTYTCECPWNSEEGTISPGVGVTGSYERPDLEPRNWPWVLHRSSTHFWPLNLLSNTLAAWFLFRDSWGFSKLPHGYPKIVWKESLRDTDSPQPRKPNNDCRPAHVSEQTSLCPSTINYSQGKNSKRLLTQPALLVVNSVCRLRSSVTCFLMSQ